MHQLYGGSFSAAELTWGVIWPILMLVALFALGVPVWVSLGFCAVGLLVATQVLPLSLFGEALFSGIDAFALIAVPLYLLTGDVMVRTRLSDQLLDVAQATLGSLRSGFGSSTLLGCGFFSCISGSDAAGAAGIGRITYGRLVSEGYPPNYAAALIASGASTGILIPPSIGYIIVGLVLGVPSSTLFIAAAVPGVMILGSILLTNIAMNWFCGYERSDIRFSFPVWVQAVWKGRWALLIPIIILGGIYSGVFTPTEAAAVAVVIAIVIGLLQGTLKLSDFPSMLESSAKVNGVILPIIALSLPLGQALGALGLPQSFVIGVTSISDDPVVITLLMIVIFMIAGCIMEGTPNIVILGPIMLPLAQSIGMDDVHFCILMMTTLGIGFITPPLGLNLFVLSGLTGNTVFGIARQAVPFVFGMVCVAVVLAFVPELSLWAVR